MRRAPVVASFVVALLAGPGWALGDIVHFEGPHPVAPDVHRGMCHVEGPHVHAYAPHKPVLYVQVKDHWTFVGDPTEFDREAPRYAYHSHHPVFWVDAEADPDAEIEHYCYISGPHHHWYAPPPRFRFELKGGVYWYVAAHPRWYRERWRKHRAIDDHYATVVIHRPVVTVEPPVGFVGVVVGPGGHRVHGRVHGGVYVAPPHVDVDVHLPSVGIRFGHAPPPPPDRVVIVPGPGRKPKGGPPPHAPAWGRRGGKGKWK